MKYCVKCGAELEDAVRFCPKCGADQDRTSSKTENTSSKSGGNPINYALIIVAVLVIVAVGLIIFLKPRSAKNSLTLAENTVANLQNEQVVKSENDTDLGEVTDNLEAETLEENAVVEEIGYDMTEEITTAASIKETKERETLKEETSRSVEDFFDQLEGTWRLNNRESLSVRRLSVDEFEFCDMFSYSFCGVEMTFSGRLKDGRCEFNDLTSFISTSDNMGNWADATTYSGVSGVAYFYVAETEEKRLELFDLCRGKTCYCISIDGNNGALDEKPPYIMIDIQYQEPQPLIDQYVIWYSSDILIGQERAYGISLDSMDSNTLRIARNEIYARHGRKFKAEDLQRYFNSCPWYYGYIEADSFDESILSEVEKKNIQYIQSLEDIKKNVPAKSGG